MVDPTPMELESMRDGGALGGEYLEHIGKFDLGTLAPDEYDMFVECIITGYHEGMQKRAAERAKLYPNAAEDTNLLPAPSRSAPPAEEHLQSTEFRHLACGGTLCSNEQGCTCNGTGERPVVEAAPKPRKRRAAK